MPAYKLLSIGNSFTQDPHRYLHDMAKRRGVNLTLINLVIGGCSYERHYRNMISDAPVYALEHNGEGTGFYVSLTEALTSDRFDFVTVQQASHFSFRPETYEPYAAELTDYVRQCQPQTKVVLQRTWEYEKDSQRLHDMGFSTTDEMFRAVAAAYDKNAAAIRADLQIPSCEAVHEALRLGLPRFHRDTFHAGLGVGRYLLSLTWLATLCGLDPLEDAFDALDVPATPEELAVARQAAHDVTVA